MNISDVWSSFGRNLSVFDPEYHKLSLRSDERIFSTNSFMSTSRNLNLVWAIFYLTAYIYVLFVYLSKMDCVEQIWTVWKRNYTVAIGNTEMKGIWIFLKPIWSILWYLLPFLLNSSQIFDLLFFGFFSGCLQLDLGRKLIRSREIWSNFEEKDDFLEETNNILEFVSDYAKENWTE